MPVGVKQKLITQLVSQVLGEEFKIQKFSWFVNQHDKIQFQDSYPVIEKIFKSLGGVACNKRSVTLQSDAYFGGKFNFLFEFDEFQHFSSARLKTFGFYPETLKLNYSVSDWRKWCLQYSAKADKYRYAKVTGDFNFEGGRTHQRAYLDCFRDLLPQHNGLNPTLRISEFEVINIDGVSTSSLKSIEKLLNKKLK